MHPYYVSDRLMSASPTLIESVETQETDMITPNNGMGSAGHMSPNHPNAVPTMGLGINSSPISATGVHGSQYPGMSFPLLSVSPQDQVDTAFPSQYQPTPVITRDIAHGLTGPTAPRSSFPAVTTPNGVYGIVGSRSSLSNGFLPSTSLPYPPPVATSSTPYLPVATSTPFVQFATPNFTMSESLYTYTNKGYTPQVSFHFQSPTFSTPPIQMMAPHSPQSGDSRGTPLSWQHTVPTSMPWAATSAANIHFTAIDTLTAQCSPTVAAVNSKRLSKRKSSSNDGGLPEKVHVNEERMAARLEELHLDNNNLQWHPDLEDQWYTQPPVTAVSSDNDEAAKEKKNLVQAVASGQHGTESISSSSRLNFTELLKIGIKSQEMLPKLIMDEITKPCMQVMLWKPPGNFVRDLVKETPSGRPGSITSQCNDTADLNDMDSPPSPPVICDVMETAPFGSSNSSWNPAVKDLDDMEL